VCTKILVRKSEGRRPSGRARGGWIILKWMLKEIGCKFVKWIQLIEDRVQWWVYFNTVIKRWLVEKAGNLTS
jgi:hypothetical protein